MHRCLPHRLSPPARPSTSCGQWTSENAPPLRSLWSVDLRKRSALAPSEGPAPPPRSPRRGRAGRPRRARDRGAHRHRAPRPRARGSNGRLLPLVYLPLFGRGGLVRWRRVDFPFPQHEDLRMGGFGRGRRVHASPRRLGLRDGDIGLPAMNGPTGLVAWWTQGFGLRARSGGRCETKLVDLHAPRIPESPIHRVCGPRLVTPRTPYSSPAGSDRRAPPPRPSESPPAEPPGPGCLRRWARGRASHASKLRRRRARSTLVLRAPRSTSDDLG